MAVNLPGKAKAPSIEEPDPLTAYDEEYDFGALASEPALAATLPWDHVEETVDEDTGAPMTIGTDAATGRRVRISQYKPPENPAEFPLEIREQDGKRFLIEGRGDGNYLLGVLNESGERKIDAPAVKLDEEIAFDPRGTEDGEPPTLAPGVVLGRTQEGRLIKVNPEGGMSTEVTETIEVDGKFYNVPTLYEDGEVSAEESFNRIVEAGMTDPETGREIVGFDSEEAAIAAAEERTAALDADPNVERAGRILRGEPVIGTAEDISQGIASGIFKAGEELMQTAGMEPDEEPDFIGNLIREARASLPPDIADLLPDLNQLADLREDLRLGSATLPGQIAEGLAQFSTGLAAFGPVSKAVPLIGSYLQFGLAGVLTDFAAFDPDDPGLGEMAEALESMTPEQLESTRRFIVENLGKEQDDSELEKRAKNAVGGFVAGAAFDSLLGLARVATKIPKPLLRALGVGAGGGAALALSSSEAQGAPGARALTQVLRRFVPASAEPLHSKALKAAEGFEAGAKMAPDQALGRLRNAQVKDEEIEWLGLEEFLKGRKSVSKEELESFIRLNQTQLHFVEAGGGPFTNAENARLSDLLAMGEARTADQDRELNWLQDRLVASTTRVEWNRPDLITEGGRNYREIKLILPAREAPGENFLSLQRKLGTFNKRSHFPEDNILAHVRAQEFNDQDGNLVLHLDELQSDWHQDARNIRKSEVRRLMREEGLSREEASKRVPEDFGFRPDDIRRPAEIMDERAALEADVTPVYLEIVGDIEKSTQNLTLPDGRNIQVVIGRGMTERWEDTLDRMVSFVTLRDTARERWDAARERWAGVWADDTVLRSEEQLLDIQARAMLAEAIDEHPLAQEIATRERHLAALDDELDVALEAGGVPRAPLHKSWHEMTMRRMIRYAAENGYNRITWTTGQAQNRRYESALRQRIERMSWDRHPNQSANDPRVRSVLSIEGTGGDINIEYDGATGKIIEVPGHHEWDGLPLSEVLGEGISDQVLESGAGELAGEAIEIGNKGMETFYDRQIPNYLKKLTKKDEAPPFKTTLDNGQEVWAYTIPERLRQVALNEGFPLYTVAGAPVAAGALSGEEEQETAGLFSPFLKRQMPERIRRRIEQRETQTAIESLDIPQTFVEETRAAYEELREGAFVEGVDFNMDTLVTSAAIKEQIDRTSRFFAADTTKATEGVVPLAETDKLATLIGADSETALDVLKKTASDVKDLHARALATRNLLVRSAEDVDALARVVAADPSKVTDQQYLALARAVEMHRNIQLHVKGVQTNIARALSAYRIPAEGGDVLAKAQMIQESLDLAGGREKLRKFAKAWLESPPEKRADLATRGWLAKTGGVVREIWINGLLSGFRTQTLNIASNAMFLTWQIPETFLAGVIGGVRRTIGRAAGIDVDGARMLESIGMMYGLRAGLTPAFKTASKAFLKDTPSSGLTKTSDVLRRKNISSENFGLDAGGFWGVTVDAIGTTVRLPTRFLMASDEFFKGTARRMSLEGQAYVAAQTAKAGGASKDEVQEIYWRIASGADDQANEAAERFAHVTTFTNALGEAGQAFQHVARRVPGAWLILPFIRTPANIISRFAERSPFAVAMPSVWRAIKNGGPEADKAIARVALGNGAMLFASQFVETGMITGGGPSDPKMRAVWLKKNSPYSINIKQLLGPKRWREMGYQREWVPYGRLEPMGMLLGVTADFVGYRQWAPREIAEQADETLMGYALSAVLKRVGDKQFFTGVAELAAAFQDPDRYAEQFIARMAGSFVPTMARDIARAQEPTLKDTRPSNPYEKDILGRQWEAVLNEWKARTPGQSEDMPPLVNFWGEERLAYEGEWYNAFNLFARRAEKNEPVDDALLELRYPIGMPDRQITFNAPRQFTESLPGTQQSISAAVKLTPWQYHGLVKAMNDVKIDGMTMRLAMNNAVQGEVWKQVTRPQDKIKILRDIRRDYLEAAKAALLDPASKHYDPVLALSKPEALRQSEMGLEFQGLEP